jgi:hypothetical protein
LVRFPSLAPILSREFLADTHVAQEPTLHAFRCRMRRTLRQSGTGDPSGAGFTELGGILDPAGLNFRLRDPPLLLGEVQHQYNQDKAAPGLAGTVKLGAWYHFGKLDDEHFDVDGKSLADGWTIQPDFQYIFLPAALSIPLIPFVGRIPGATVFALRTAISF